MSRFLTIPLLLAAASVYGSEIYLRDGVTDGDTFYLSNVALVDDDAALQSWVSYSLTRSACQLQIGGPNPARASSFRCELLARQHLLETWHERTQQIDSVNNNEGSEYLDELSLVADEGFLDEYVAHYFGRKSWSLPGDLQMAAFDDWRRDNLRKHKPDTRWIGSWNYASNVMGR
jgi:hypothetical protein